MVWRWSETFQTCLIFPENKRIMENLHAMFFFFDYIGRGRVLTFDLDRFGRCSDLEHWAGLSANWNEDDGLLAGSSH